MLELLISILMALGIHFSPIENGKIGISSADMTRLETSTIYHMSGADRAFDDIVITDGADPKEDIVITDGADPDAGQGSHE